MRLGVDLHLVGQDCAAVDDDLLLARELAGKQLDRVVFALKLEVPDVLQLGGFDGLSDLADLAVGRGKSFA